MNFSTHVVRVRLQSAFLAALLAAGLPALAQQPAAPSSQSTTGPGGGSDRKIDPDAAMAFTRPAESPGLGAEMKNLKAGKDGFISMFNGKDLTGWDALPRFWSVKDGAMECVETPDKGGNVQSDIIWIDSRLHPEKYTNVEIRVKYRWLSQSGNSGVQFRGVINVDSTKHVAGYQADMDPPNQYTGAIYDESTIAGRRTKDVQSPHIAPRGYKTTYLADGGAGKTEPLAEDAKTLATFLKPVKGDFNDMVIVVNGSRMTITINGHLFSELVDENPAALNAGGIVAIQQHAGAGMQVQFKDMKIRFLK